MAWQKKYRWTRTWGDEPGLNGLPHEDYVGWEGDFNIGRIYLDVQTLHKNEWRWCGYGPKRVPVLLPHNGWKPTSAEAAKAVEDYYDRMVARRDAGHGRDQTT